MNIDETIRDMEWERYVDALIKNTATVGTARRFDQDPGYEVGVADIRNGPEGAIHVLLFSQSTDSATRAKLHGFIHGTLQAEMDARLARL